MPDIQSLSQTQPVAYIHNFKDVGDTVGPIVGTTFPVEAARDGSIDGTIDGGKTIVATGVNVCWLV